MSKKLSADLSSYVKLNADGKVISNTIYNALQSVIDPYSISNNVQVLVNAKVNGAFLSSLSIEDILQTAAEGIPYTFFENYYKHLNLHDAQY